MKVYEFVLPVQKAGREFTTTLTLRYGGVTSWLARGAWWNEHARELESENVIVYQVATWKGESLKTFVETYAKGVHEKALYFAEVGRANIISL